MTQDTPGPLVYATAAFAVGALLEYPLAKRFPLRGEVRRPRGSKCLRPGRVRRSSVPSMGTRMLVAGGLAFASTFVVFYLVSAFRSRPQLPQ
jgi:hypothetical protein